MVGRGRGRGDEWDGVALTGRWGIGEISVSSVQFEVYFYFRRREKKKKTEKATPLVELLQQGQAVNLEF